MDINQFAVIDLFCGVGGLSHGFLKEGFVVAAGIDLDETCRYAFEKNNKSQFIHKDVSLVTAEELINLYPKNARRILVGCAPCQPFSRYTNASKQSMASSNVKKDDKWKLLYSFLRLIEETEPEVVSMENVPQLVSYDKGSVYKDFYSGLCALGYEVTAYSVNACEYGVPQRRQRLVLFASKIGQIQIIPKTHGTDNYETVAKAIGHLEPIQDGDICQTDKLHRARKLSEINKKRIMATPKGGSWKDWDESLILECHKKESGREFGSVYGRMKWEEPSPTLTTWCTGLSNGRFGHPEQHRAISLREAALLQSFPEGYEFIEDNSPIVIKNIARHIGNAVPVNLGKAIAKSIKKHVNKMC